MLPPFGGKNTTGYLRNSLTRANWDKKLALAPGHARSVPIQSYLPQYLSESRILPQSIPLGIAQERHMNVAIPNSALQPFEHQILLAQPRIQQRNVHRRDIFLAGQCDQFCQSVFCFGVSSTLRQHISQQGNRLRVSIGGGGGQL